MIEIQGNMLKVEERSKVSAVRFDGARCATYVQPGRLYPIEFDEGDGYAFVTANNGRRIRIRYERCPHIGGAPWTCLVKEGRSDDF